MLMRLEQFDCLLHTTIRAPFHLFLRNSARFRSRFNAYWTATFRMLPNHLKAISARDFHVSAQIAIEIATLKRLKVYRFALCIN